MVVMAMVDTLVCRSPNRPCSPESITCCRRHHHYIITASLLHHHSIVIPTSLHRHYIVITKSILSPLSHPLTLQSYVVSLLNTSSTQPSISALSIHTFFKGVTILKWFMNNIHVFVHVPKTPSDKHFQRISCCVLYLLCGSGVVLFSSALHLSGPLTPGVFCSCQSMVCKSTGLYETTGWSGNVCVLTEGMQHCMADVSCHLDCVYGVFPQYSA